MMKISPIFFSKSNLRDPWTNLPLSWIQKMVMGNFRLFGRVYHRYKLHGMDKIKSSHCLLVGYHSRPTVDMFYLLAEILPTFLVTDLLFIIPILGHIARECGAIPSHDSTGSSFFVHALRTGDRPVVLLPGGINEMTKPSEEKFKVLWKSEPGFCRILVDELNNDRLDPSIQILPFYTRNCEKIFINSSWWHDQSGLCIQKWMKKIRDGNHYFIPPLVTVIIFSTGFFITPLPVRLATYLGDPITMCKGESAEHLASRTAASLQALIDKTNAIPDEEDELSVLDRVDMVVNGILMSLQNVLNIGIVLFFTWTIVPLGLIIVPCYNYGRGVSNTEKK